MSFYLGKTRIWFGGIACLEGLAMLASGKGDGTPPSDPQIVGIVVTANQIDIDTGSLRLRKRRARRCETSLSRW